MEKDMEMGMDAIASHFELQGQASCFAALQFEMPCDLSLGVNQIEIKLGVNEMYDSLLKMLIDNDILRDGYFMLDRRFVVEPAYNRIGFECEDIRYHEFVTFGNLDDVVRWLNKKRK